MSYIEDEVKCSECPNASHGFDRNASHNEGRYVCQCESHKCPAESLRRELAEARQEIADRKADCETGHDQDEKTIAELRQQLAASQAREQQLLDLLPARTPGGFVSFGKNYAEAEDKFNDPRNPMCRFKRIYLDACEQALALPQDTIALEAMIAKAGEVMRERCAVEIAETADMVGIIGHSDRECLQVAIRALPAVTFEDLK